MDKRLEEPSTNTETVVFKKISDHFLRLLKPENFKLPYDQDIIQKLLDELENNASIFIIDDLGGHKVPNDKILALPVDTDKGFSALVVLINQYTAEEILNNKQLLRPSNRQLIKWAEQTLELYDKVAPEDKPTNKEHGNQSFKIIAPSRYVFTKVEKQYQPSIPELPILPIFEKQISPPPPLNPHPPFPTIISKN